MRLALIALACVSCATSAPTTRERGPREGGDRTIVIRNGTSSPVGLDQTLGPATSLAIIDVEGREAPIAPFIPPHPCDGPCGGERAECAWMAAPISIAPGEAHRIEWDGTLRRRGHHDGPCFERAPAPEGEYLVQACARGEYCGLAHVSVPGDESIEIVIGEPPTSVRCAPDELSRAIRIAIGAGVAEGVDVRSFAGCPSEARCDGPALEVTAGRCRVRVRRSESIYQVELFPSAEDGNPGAVEVWVDHDAVRSGYIYVRDGRWAVSRDGELAIIGITETAMHTHGGDPAQISSVELAAFNRGARPRVLRLRGARWQTNVAEPVLLPSARFENGSEITVAPGERAAFRLHFDAQSAYQGARDRFAVEAELDVDGETLRPLADVSVTRLEPMEP